MGLEINLQECMHKGLVGAIGAIPGTVCAHPFDVVKIRMQTSGTSDPFRGGVRKAINAVAAGGERPGRPGAFQASQFFRGLAPAMQQKVITRAPMFLLAELCTQTVQIAGLSRTQACFVGCFCSGFITGSAAALPEYRKVLQSQRVRAQGTSTVLAVMRNCWGECCCIPGDGRWHVDSVSHIQKTMARDTRTSCSQSMSVPGVMEELAEHITLGDVPAAGGRRLNRHTLKATGSAGGSTPLSLGTAKAKAKVQAPAKEDSGSWVLPSVDKDISEYYTGRAPCYAWVQTSETLYLFTPLRNPQMQEATTDEEKEPANAPHPVQLDLTNEGKTLRLMVEGNAILDGSLAHAIKPGDEIWMIEEAPDGRDFVVVELDKLVPGINWSSVLEPQVDVLGPYSHPVVKMPDILTEEEESLVAETLQHLRRTKRTLQPVEGRAAARGDVISVDMQGYEMKEDGSRGNELDVGSAKGLELELGASTFSAEVERSLEGIAMGETRDVQVADSEQLLPELNDEFAKEIKREEQFKQAGTMEGIPEEEEGVAKVRQVAQTQVTCHWADLGSQEATAEEAGFSLEVPEQRLLLVAICRNSGRSAGFIEELAVAARFVAEKEARTCQTGWSLGLVESEAAQGLMQKIDMDDVERKTWSKQLGEPDEGETLKQVGKDPPREYQAEVRLNKLSSFCEVLSWLRYQMEDRDSLDDWRRAYDNRPLHSIWSKNKWNEPVRSALTSCFQNSRFMVTSLQYMHRHVGDCVDQVYRTHAEKQAGLLHGHNRAFAVSAEQPEVWRMADYFRQHQLPNLTWMDRPFSAMIATDLPLLLVRLWPAVRATEQSYYGDVGGPPRIGVLAKRQATPLANRILQPKLNLGSKALRGYGSNFGK
ncbi:Trigger factor [Symbiodinium microadriaticum]|uniref:Trigger factor n=1 Tax=Symbiodinium microadriaticum TaxID=2951 RepID=A0A1Q9D6N6_SYMMI|nr:Trigger factor [Symbiodinium microadriaticum]